MDDTAATEEKTGKVLKVTGAQPLEKPAAGEIKKGEETPPTKGGPSVEAKEKPGGAAPVQKPKGQRP